MQKLYEIAIALELLPGRCPEDCLQAIFSGETNEIFLHSSPICLKLGSKKAQKPTKTAHQSYPILVIHHVTRQSFEEERPVKNEESADSASIPSAGHGHAGRMLSATSGRLDSNRTKTLLEAWKWIMLTMTSTGWSSLLLLDSEFYILLVQVQTVM